MLNPFCGSRCCALCCVCVADSPRSILRCSQGVELVRGKFVLRVLQVTSIGYVLKAV